MKINCSLLFFTVYGTHILDIYMVLCYIASLATLCSVSGHGYNFIYHLGNDDMFLIELQWLPPTDSMSFSLFRFIIHMLSTGEAILFYFLF